MNRFGTAKRIILSALTIAMVLAFTVSCDSSPADAKYDLSQAEGVCFHYSDFSIYITDEDIALVEDTLNNFSLCLSVDYEEVAVKFDEALSADVYNALSSRPRIEVVFSSPLALPLMRKNGDDFVLNDYSSIIIPADGDEVYVQKDGIYSSKVIKSVDTSIISALLEKYRAKLEEM